MPLWHGLFYTSLVVATVLNLVAGSHTWQQTGVLLGLSLVFGLWYTASVVVSPLSWQGRPLLIMAYLAIGWSIWFGLTVLNPVYLFVLFGLYPQVFVSAPLPGKIFGALLLTVLCALQQVTLAGGIGGNLFLTLAAGVSGILMALFIYASASSNWAARSRLKVPVVRGRPSRWHCPPQRMSLPHLKKRQRRSSDATHSRADCR
jgi:hypothetical protein